MTALCHRGVWTAPWRGPNGEVELIVVDSQHRKVAGALLPKGVDHVAASDAMWDLLDQLDPDYSVAIGSPPAVGKLARSGLKLVTADS